MSPLPNECQDRGLGAGRSKTIDRENERDRAKRKIHPLFVVVYQPSRTKSRNLMFPWF